MPLVYLNLTWGYTVQKSSFSGQRFVTEFLKLHPKLTEPDKANSLTNCGVCDDFGPEAGVSRCTPRRFHAKLVVTFDLIGADHLDDPPQDSIPRGILAAFAVD
jgi:hypothetical protein